MYAFIYKLFVANYPLTFMTYHIYHQKLILLPWEFFTMLWTLFLTMYHISSHSGIIRYVFLVSCRILLIIFLVYLEILWILLIVLSDSTFVTLIGRILSIFNISVTLAIVIMDVYKLCVKMRLMTGLNVLMDHLVIGM